MINTEGSLENLLSGFLFAISDTIDNPKATVLPEPVWAETSASRPVISFSITAFWIGVNYV